MATKALKLRLGMVLAACAAASGCARQEGAVELDWSIVDGDFEDLFPGQRYSSSCAFKELAQLSLNPADPNNPSRIQVDLKLQLRLRVYDCPENQTLEECEQGPLIAKEVFSCDHMRGTIGNLPSSESSYLFVVDTLLSPSEGPAMIARQSCVATPGARRRRIRAGQITNLAVYQVVLQGSESRPLQVHECASTRQP